MIYSKNINYRLLLGHFLKELKKIEDKSTDTIFRDPPYKLRNDGITCNPGKMVSVNMATWYKSESLVLDYRFNLKWLKSCDRVLKNDRTMWI